MYYMPSKILSLMFLIIGKKTLYRAEKCVLRENQVWFFMWQDYV